VVDYPSPLGPKADSKATWRPQMGLQEARLCRKTTMCGSSLCHRFDSVAHLLIFINQIREKIA